MVKILCKVLLKILQTVIQKVLNTVLIFPLDRELNLPRIITLGRPAAGAVQRLQPRPGRLPTTHARRAIPVVPRSRGPRQA
jgi:hypothetical protein